MTEANTYVQPSTGIPTCRACTAAAQARYQQRKKLGIALGKRVAPPPKTHCLHGHEFTEATIYWHSGKRHCKECRRERDRRPRTPEEHRDQNLKRKYGSKFGAAAFLEMLEAQNGCCALCEVSLEGRPTTRIHVDHCHDTGVVRGILCPNCNSALGKFGDSVERLRRAIRYLESGGSGMGS